MKLKVCGMKYYDNIVEVAGLQPDYLGLIFYEKSPRYFNGALPQIPSSVKKVGVFVNADIEFIFEHVESYDLQSIQLHGQESPGFCSKLKNENKLLEIIKVFSIIDEFDFNLLKPYEDVCDYFLFDTKGKLPGGNGFTFKWNILENYPSTKPYFLSGGIGLDQLKNLKGFLDSSASKYCHSIDVNSKFEIKPGLKNSVELNEFKSQI